MQRILVFGGPGAGSSTLGLELSTRIDLPLLDIADFFSIPPKEFHARPQSPEEEQKFQDALGGKRWILAGSIASWNSQAEPFFDGVIYLQLRRTLRLTRLREREIQRLGEEVTEPSHKGFKRFNQYMYWASQFDQAGMERESKILHENWLRNLAVPILRLDASAPVENCVSKIFEDWFSPQE